MRYILLALTLASCTTTKYVDRERVVTDSTASSELRSLQTRYSRDSSLWQLDREAWANTGVVFEERVDTVTLPGRVEYYDNGRIKSVEGRLKAVSQALGDKSRELEVYDRTVQDMADSLAVARVALSKKEVRVEKRVERRVAWWSWLLLVLGWVARGYWPNVRKRFNI